MVLINPGFYHCVIQQSFFRSNMSSSVEVIVEAQQASTSALPQSSFCDAVVDFVAATRVWSHGVAQSGFAHEGLEEHLGKLVVQDVSETLRIGQKIVVSRESHITVLPYRVFNEDPCNEDSTLNEEEIAFGRSWILPHASFEGLWENLHYETGMKEKQIAFMETLMTFSVAQVKSEIVAANRMLMFHGPPGTGKTTLCKALAQKLSIRLRNEFKCGQFVEINSHALFSKWFSESGKLVSCLFEKIREMLEDKRILVFVMIDEVESLSLDRSSCSSEPGDAIRVVNALLTQLDSLKVYPNLLVLTTSNLIDSIDPAFLDRADVIQYVPNPGLEATYEILRSCLMELVEKNVLKSGGAQLHAMLPSFPELCEVSAELLPSAATAFKLRDLARSCQGMSGRALRKLPVLAHAQHLSYEAKRHLSIDAFLAALEAAATAVQRKSQLSSLSSGIASLNCGSGSSSIPM